MAMSFPEWAPLAALAATAAGWIACLALFLSLKQKLRTVLHTASDLRSHLEEAQSTWQNQAAALESRLRSEEERASMLTPPAPPRSGFNLSKRTQVIRLSRRGEPVALIASTLQLPRAEVELLLKVEKLAGERQANYAATEH